jgi:hypothetical protein
VADTTNAVVETTAADSDVIEAEDLGNPQKKGA